MNELKIDERHLVKFVNSTKELIKNIDRDLSTIANQEEDVFIRYMSYSRLATIIDIITKMMPVVTNTFRLGFDLNYEQFCTKAFIKAGWNDGNMEDNPFFVGNKQEEEDNEAFAIEMSELPDDAKKILVSIIKQALIKRKKECH